MKGFIRSSIPSMQHPFRGCSALLLSVLLSFAPLSPVFASAVTWSLEGNTLLPATTVAEVLKPLSPPVTMEAIQAAINQLQVAYRKAGYGAVVVTLPEQTISGSNIRLLVTEGKLGNVYLKGNHYFSDANIRRSMPSLASGATPNLILTDANTLQANDNPAKQSRVTLQPGETTGAVDALIVTRERKPQVYSLGFDNTGNESTGRYRVSGSYQHANLFDRDQVLGLRVEASPDTSAHSNAASLSYLVPMYTINSAFEVAASYSDVQSKTIATAVGAAEFAGKGDAVALRYHWYLPALGAAKQKLLFGVDLRHYRNNCSIGIFGSAGCGAAAADITVQPLSIGYAMSVMNQYDASLVVSRNQWPGGKNGGPSDFDAARSGANSRYTIVRGGFNANFPLGEKSTLAWRNNFQYSNDALVAGEQSGAGGANSVRGYEERELTGDKGVLSSLEFSTLLFTGLNRDADVFPHQLRGVVFGDWGRVMNNKGTPCDSSSDSCGVGSVGLGVRWNYHNQFFARGDVARALEDGSQTNSGRYRLHFALGYGF